MEAERVGPQWRESWRNSTAALELCRDDFAEAREKAQHWAFRGEAKAAIIAVDEAQLEEFQEEATEVAIEAESEREGASLRQHHNETGGEFDD